jgi:hypothetical protein
VSRGTRAVAHGPTGVRGARPVSLLLVTDPSATPDPAAPSEQSAGPEPHPATAQPRAAATAGPHRPTGAVNPGPVEYKGQPLDSERGPGLGCFRFQLVVLVVLIVATPLSVGRLPEVVTVVLLFAMIGLLLVSGQTIIFLLRLISADRRGRRQPMAGGSPTVGQLEDAAADGSAEAGEDQAEAAVDDTGGGAPPADPGSPASGPVRQ